MKKKIKPIGIDPNADILFIDGDLVFPERDLKKFIEWKMGKPLKLLIKRAQRRHEPR